MSQWFGGPGRKSGKTPDGAPDDSAGVSRGPTTGKFGRPAPRNQQAKPQLDEAPQATQPRAQAARPQQSQAGWQPTPPPTPTSAQQAYQQAAGQTIPARPPQPGQALSGQPPSGQAPYGQPPAASPQQFQNPQQFQSPQQIQNPAPQSTHRPLFNPNSAPQQSPRPSQVPPPLPQPPNPFQQNQYPPQAPAQPQMPQQLAQRPSQREPRYDQYDQYDDYDESESNYQDANTEGEDPDYEPERIEFKKRIVALIVDFLACYILAMGVMLIPFVNSFVSSQLVMSCFLLVRDYFFEGRGVGKNVMGLQVIDEASGNPCSLKQSFMRNIVLVAPYALTQIVSAVLRLVPIPSVNQIITNIDWGLCGLYVLIVFPMEVYRSYSRSDGLRYGDELAGTVIVESAMDFSKPLPRR
jgi:hypothetical protein